MEYLPLKRANDLLADTEKKIAILKQIKTKAENTLKAGAILPCVELPDGKKIKYLGGVL
jgi:hypothetical protein